MDAAEGELSHALMNSSHDSGANWLVYLIAKKRNRDTVALEALKRLFALDPFNENVVDELIDIGVRSKRLPKDPIATQILANRKWYSNDLKKKISKHLDATLK